MRRPRQPITTNLYISIHESKLAFVQRKDVLAQQSIVNRTAASSFAHFTRRRHRKSAEKNVTKLVTILIPQPLEAASSPRTSEQFPTTKLFLTKRVSDQQSRRTGNLAHLPKVSATSSTFPKKKNTFSKACIAGSAVHRKPKQRTKTRPSICCALHDEQHHTTTTRIHSPDHEHIQRIHQPLRACRHAHTLIFETKGMLSRAHPDPRKKSAGTKLQPRLKRMERRIAKSVRGE